MQISINELLHIIPAINSTQEDDADDESEQYAVPASLMRTEGHYTLQKAIKRAIQYLRGTTYMDTWLSKPDEWTSEGKLRNGKSFEKEFMLSSSGGKSKTNYQNIKFNYPNEVILIFCAIVTVSLCTDMFDSRVFKIAGEKKQVSYQSLRDSLVSEETGKKQSVRLVENQEFVNRMGDALRYAVTKFQDGFSSGKILFDGKKEENTDLSFYWSVDGSKWANYTSQDFSLVKRKKLTSDDGRAEFDNLKKEHENNYQLIKIKQNWNNLPDDTNEIVSAILFPRLDLQIALHDAFDRQFNGLLREIRKKWNNTDEISTEAAESVLKNLNIVNRKLN